MAKKSNIDPKEYERANAAAQDLDETLNGIHSVSDAINKSAASYGKTSIGLNAIKEKGLSLSRKIVKQETDIHGISISLGKELSSQQQKLIERNNTLDAYKKIKVASAVLDQDELKSKNESAKLDMWREQSGRSELDLYNKHSDILDTIKDRNSEIVSIGLSHLETQSDYINNDLRMVELSDDKLQVARELAEVENRISSIKSDGTFHGNLAAKIEKDNLTRLKENLTVQQQSINALDDKQKVLKIEQGLIQESYGKMTDMTDNLFSSIERIPGGGLISKAFNFDGIKEGINSKIGDTLQGALTGAGKQVTILGRTFTMALGPVGLIVVGLAAAAAVVSLLVSQFNKIDGMTSEIAKNQGLSKKEAQEQLKFATGMANSTNSIWVNSEGILEATSEVRENLGGMLPSYENMNERGKELIKNQQMLTEAFHLTGEEATGFQNTAQLLGVSTSELIANVTQVENAIESTTGGTINTKEIMQDIAKIPPSIAAGFKGTTTELIATVAKAKSLGMNLEQINAIGEASLDIESSLANEMEARVITGRNINLDAMRQAQMMGDQSKVMEELVKNAGTYSEFKAMGYMQQKALAKAMGMTTDEMTTMLQKAELQNQLGQDISSYSAEQLETMIKQGEITGEQAIAMAKQAAAEKRSASVTESMNAIWSKIKDVIFGLVAGPLGDFATYLSDALSDGDALNGIMDAIKGTFSVISTIVNIIVTPIGWMVWAFGQINSLIDGIFGFFSSGKDDVEGTESGFKNILKAVTAIGGGLLLWKKLLKPMKGMIGKVAGGIKDKIMPGKSKAEDIVSKKKSKGPGAMEKFAKGISKIDGKKLLAGAAAMVLLAGAVFILAKAMQEFAEVSWEDIGKGVVAMLALAGTAILVGLGAPTMLLGAAAMLVIAGAMWILGKALQQFTEVSWEDIGKGIVAMLALAGTAALVSLAAPAMFIGAAAMLVIAGAMWLFGKAVQELATGAELLGEALGGVLSSITNLANIEGGGANLIAMGAGLIAIAVGLAALTAGSIIDGIASLFGGGSAKWLDTLKETSEINGDNISKVGEGLMSIASAFEALSKVDLDKVGKALDKVESLSEGDIGDKLLKVTNAIGITKPKETDESTQDSDESFSFKKIDTGKAKSTPDSDASLSPNSESDTQTQILELLKVIASSLSQPVNLNLDGQTLGKLEKATTLNRQMRLGVDNSYGQTVQT